MAYQIPPFLKRDKDSLLFNSPGEMIYYIPEVYFDRGAAELNGEYVNLFGLFYYAIFDEKGKHSGLKTFKFPTVFTCRPSSIEKVKDIKLTKNLDESDYRLLKFYKDDQAVSCVHCIEDVSNTELFFRIFNSGKMPILDYRDFYTYFNESLNLNGSDFGLSAQIFGIVVSEMCRSSKDKNVLFRHTDMHDMTDYKFIAITDVPKLVSPYTSITSENWDNSLTAALTIKNPKDTPLEKLMID